MAFDKTTRNRLATFVGKARDLIADEFTQQFQSLYGISDNGTVTPLDKLSHLDDIGRSIAALLRERIDYFIKTHPEERDGKKAAVIRLAREQAFTILNRLAAIRMAEKRDLIVESVGKGYQSKGFKVFEQVAGAGLGETYHRYRRYIFCLFDELAVDLGILFDRRSPQGLLFPREKALQELFTLLNAPDLDPLWSEDETIGWIYQYYNDPAERKKMREESAAPRNSRELAVRNQFFTPRYVVEFLTDNTLGRIWYEMTQGKTRLKDQCRYLVRRPIEIFIKPDEAVPESTAQDDLSQEELLKQPVYIPFRLMKDPRFLLMLDPACGSMHFGLYSFDLYEVIYEEAWDLGVDSLLHDYPKKEDFLRQVPRLIIEHNIHGIDIDPRAVQIAGLSLWFRAQKSWQAQKISAADRPRITRSNIVCAEPMPGSLEMLKEFTASLHPPLLGQLVEKVFAQMQLAGEAGSLLKIEEDIAVLIEEAKNLWTSPRKVEQTKFDLGMGEKQKQGSLPLDVSGITDEQFWETAEERIYTALKGYAEQADSSDYQRRLFAEDAARGFAFIDLCRKRYDVVVMNPPFGEYQVICKIYFSHVFPNTSNDLLAMFVERSLEWAQTGYAGGITSRTCFFLTTFSKMRTEVLKPIKSPFLLADLGKDVMDNAMVEAAAYCSGRHPFENTVFIKGLNVTDRSMLMMNVATELSYGKVPDNTLLRNIDLFSFLEGSPLCYWASDRVLRLFIGSPRIESEDRRVRVGLQTGEDFRYIRLWWETPLASDGWVFHPKGGETFRFAGDVHLLVNWAKNGKEIRSDSRSRVQNEGFYFKAGLTSSYRCAFYSPALFPAGMITGVAGSAIYSTEKDLWWLLAIGNSSAVDSFIKLRLGSSEAGIIQVGHLQNTPLPKPTKEQRNKLNDLGRKAWAIQFQKLVSSEVSPYFLCMEAVKVGTHTLPTVLNEIDEVAREVYNVKPIDIQALVEQGNHFEYDSDDLNEQNLSNVVGILIQAIGTVFGRWDIRFATGERQPPKLPDPFAPLPVCPPGMLQNADGLPVKPKDVPADYPLRISWPGILVDDENHTEDIVARIREALEVVWKDRADAIEQEACELLGVKNLRDYFRRPAGFFADHLKRYSKSRRQAPIYWPLSSANGSYTLWIYYHRLTDQALHTALADFVDPKIKAVRTEISALRESGNHRDHLEELLDLEKELSEFRAEIERVIKLPWKPNLNDGVIITASPLWKLFRLPKWQKDLKACWEKLEKGEYEWAHLAYSIWPKRVEDICKKDRSIAIAHNLEHLCETTPPKAKAKRRKKRDLNE